MARKFVTGSSQSLHADSTPVTAAPFTVSGWSWTSDTTVDKSVIWIGDKDSSNQYWELIIRSDEDIRWIARGGGAAQAAAGAGTFNLSAWNHLGAIERGATDRELYYNGSSVATDATSKTPTGADRISLGRNGSSTPTNYMDGRLAELAVWNIGLTDPEMALLGLGYSPLLIRPQNLIFYSPLIRDEDIDIVGGISLTPVATPTIGDHTRVLRSAQHWAMIPAAAGGAFTLPMDQGSYALTGQTIALTSARTLALAQGAYTLTGQDLLLPTQRQLLLDQGSYALTGQNLLLKTERQLLLGQGSYALNGQALAFIHNITLPIAQGPYALAGQIALLTAQRQLLLGQGSYALTGQPLTLTYSPTDATITLDQGSYALTGQALALQANRQLPLAQGAHALTGQALALAIQRQLLLAQGAYTLAGQDVTLTYVPAGGAFTLLIDQGAYTLTGQSLALKAARQLLTAQANYTLTGQPPGLTTQRPLALHQGS